MAARNFLAETRSAGNEETWNILVAKFPSEDHAAVSAAAADAVPASATEGEDGNAPSWRPDNEHASEVLFDAISSLSALSGPGNDGQWFAHLQPFMGTDIGPEEFGKGSWCMWGCGLAWSQRQVLVATKLTEERARDRKIYILMFEKDAWATKT